MKGKVMVSSLLLLKPSIIRVNLSSGIRDIAFIVNSMALALISCFAVTSNILRFDYRSIEKTY